MIAAASETRTRFSADTYRQRRARLREAVGEGLLFFPGNPLVWRNADETHPFRQNSHLLWLTGLRRPGLALVLDAGGEEILFGPPEDPDEVIWSGPHPALADEAAQAGLTDVRDYDALADYLRDAQRRGQIIHYLPPFMPGVQVELARLLGKDLDVVEAGASEDLVRAIGALRATKTEAEIAEMEDALAVSAEMYRAAMERTAPGTTEAAVRAAMVRVALEHDYPLSFKPIVSVRGEVLHNEAYTNILEAGHLLLLDTGVETPNGYASDITRTIPVSGTFTERQRAVYQVVLRAQEDAIAAMRPGTNWQDVHLLCARTIAAGLNDLGLMRGDVDAAVEAGAHALFFPHGLGHLIGLDVHDTEDLGDVVTYTPERPRSTQFGRAYLRFGRDLEAGHVLTVEPGIYFIPALIDRWQAAGRHTDFIDYERVAEYRDFGGIRIEDDVLVTDDGARVLGPGIPKQPDAVEAAMAAGRRS